MNGLKWRAFGAEFVGTFALIFVGVGSIAMDFIAGGKVGLVGIALAHGLTIAVMASAVAAVSGGHLNPAVTVSALVVRKIEPLNAVGYVVFQCLGAIVAALLLKALLPGTALDHTAFGTPAPGPGISGGAALGIEAILTFFLVFVIFGTAIDHRAPKVGALFIGLTVSLDILAGVPLTGAAMNPARWLGPALIGGGHLGDFWIYLAGPFLGGIAAALFYMGVLAQREETTADPFPLGPAES